MDDSGHRQGAAAHRPDDRVAGRPAEMERHQGEQSRFRTHAGGPAPGQHSEESFEDVRQAIYRTYK